MSIRNRPYHYEHGEEEWLLVLAGTPSLRTPAGVERLAPWDLVCFPPAPAGAHAGDKVGVWTGDRDQDLVVRRASGVDYYDGETQR